MMRLMHACCQQILLAHLCVLHADPQVLWGEEHLLELHDVWMKQLTVVVDLSAYVDVIDALAPLQELDGNLRAGPLQGPDAGAGSSGLLLSLRSWQGQERCLTFRPVSLSRASCKSHKPHSAVHW